MIATLRLPYQRCVSRFIAERSSSSRASSGPRRSSSRSTYRRNVAFVFRNSLPRRSHAYLSRRRRIRARTSGSDSIGQMYAFHSKSLRSIQSSRSSSPSRTRRACSRARAAAAARRSRSDRSAGSRAGEPCRGSCARTRRAAARAPRCAVPARRDDARANGFLNRVSMPDRQRDREPPVDPAVVVAAEVEDARGRATNLRSWFPRRRRPASTGRDRDPRA